MGADFVGMNPLHALLNRGNDVSPYSPVSRLFRNPIYIDVDARPRAARRAGARRRASTSAEIAAASWRAARDDRGAVRAGDGRERPRARRLASRLSRARSRIAATTATAHTTIVRRRERSGADALRDLDGDRRDRAASGTELARRGQRSFAIRRLGAVLRFARDHATRVDFHRWVQFELDRQLGEAAADARASGMAIGLYQDLAIGTSPAGADTWAFPELFVRGVSVGAPPDPYSDHWAELGAAADRPARAPARPLSVFHPSAAQRLSPCRRAAHRSRDGALPSVLDSRRRIGRATARTCAIPADDLLGILALESVRHRALVVGEDLGTVPDEVPPALAKWGVLSSKVLYFERDHDGGFKTRRELSRALARDGQHARHADDRRILERARHRAAPAGGAHRVERRRGCAHAEARARERDALLRRLRRGLT